MSSKILVTGAAGGVGSTSREAIRILVSKGRRVRAMVRTMDERAESLKAMGAEVVVADLLDIIAVPVQSFTLQCRFRLVIWKKQQTSQ
jgi:uncharacterized protein YbjT (DUF2867 family)